MGEIDTDMIGKEKKRSTVWKEILIEKTLLASAMVSVVVVILIFAFLLSQGVPAFGKISIIDFLSGIKWEPTSVIAPSFGTLPLLYGTMLVTAIAMVVSVPLGLMVAIYIAEVAHPLEKEILKPVIELLSAVPSVIFGLFAMILLATWIQQLTGTNYRLNALNGGVILAIMILPTIVSLAEDAITAVPREYKEAAIALGASRWETVRSVLLPSASSGILAAIFLGFGRAVGETMAVLMATGNVAAIGSILQPARTITSTIAIETLEVDFGGLHYNALFALAIELFLITFAFNYLADVIGKRLRRMGR
jgi:phosphate transport system permease protein